MNISDHLRTKIEKRALELFEKGHTNDDIDNINIRKDISKKLLSYQTLHTFNMIVAVNHNLITVDGSYTGTGKTYTTAAVCAQLGLIPFVICTMSIMNRWKDVLDYFGVEYVAIVNYESIRSLKYRNKDGKKVECPYIKKQDGQFVWDFSSNPKAKNIVIIFD